MSTSTSNNCRNCFTGCEVVSDRCVKYTGPDIAYLGISSGDSLAYIEQKLANFLISALTAGGIKVDIEASVLCTYIDSYLPECDEINAKDLFLALIQAACDLNSRVVILENFKTSLESDYTVTGLSGVTPSSGTHAILQAVINALASLNSSFAAFQSSVPATYVSLSNLNSLIQAYLDSLPDSNKHYKKMVPYTVVEYYGPLSNFDATGAGIGDWEKIYLCNGLNGTPDKRGRVPVGAIAGVPGGSLDPEVDPGMSSFNPNYSISGPNSKAGSNYTTLNVNQIPSHSHGLTQTPHFHRLASNTASSAVLLDDTQFMTREGDITNETYRLSAASSPSPTIGKSSSETIPISVNPSGGGQPHSNVQPVIACYYIMYIP